MPPKNRYVEAFKENANLIGVAALAALSAALLTPLPVLAGLVAEAAYLVFVPDSKWYEARLSRRYDAEVEKRRQQFKADVFPLLRVEMQQRFLALEETRRQIHSQPMDQHKWFREVLRKLDFLLEKFLQFARKEAQFRAYLRSIWNDVHGGQARGGRNPIREPEESRRQRRDPDEARRRLASRPMPESAGEDDLPLGPTDRWVQQVVGDVQAQYDREIAHLRELLAAEDDANTKAVLEKRLDVLQRRHEFVGKIARILTNLNHQLELLEDTFGLINDEIRARSPEQVLTDIEDVVWQTESMTKLLEEVAPYEQLISRMGN